MFLDADRQANSMAWLSGHQWDGDDYFEAGSVHVTCNLDIAEEATEAFFSVSSATPFHAVTARSGLAILAILRNDISGATEQYAVLGSEQGTMPKVIAEPAIDRVLGLLSMTIGRVDDAMSHFEDALAFCRKAGYRPELAWTSCDYADTQLRRANPGDREKAMTLLDESLAITGELDMRPLMERVLSRREILRA